MKLKLLTTAALIAFGAMAAHAAEESPYFKIHAGSAHYKKIKLPENLKSARVKNTAIIGLEFGSKFNDQITLGVGLDFRPNIKTKSDELDMKGYNFTTMVNAYYNINAFGAFKPYFGIGAGFSNIHVKKTQTHKKQNVKGLAWQAMAGVNLAVNETTDFNIGYRYVDLHKVKVYSINNPNLYAKSKLRGNEILAGFTFKTDMFGS